MTILARESSGPAATEGDHTAARDRRMRSSPQAVSGSVRFLARRRTPRMRLRKEHLMNHEIERHKQMIEASGMGLLPGIGLAFALCLIVMTALLAETWWTVALVLTGLFAITAIVVWVI